jgi:6-methylsalicylate decarboxylase
MDLEEIATGILSLTAPSVARWLKLQHCSMARRVNDFTAGGKAARPLRQLRRVYARDTYANGVILISNCGLKYLGDPAFEPLWA